VFDHERATEFTYGNITIELYCPRLLGASPKKRRHEYP
jgi:hypothetical protein